MRARLCLLLAILALCPNLLACSGEKPAVDPTTPAAQVGSIEQRISGVWRLTNYIPENELSPALLLSMQADKITIRFETGKVRTLGSSLSFERRYRIMDVKGDLFTLFIEDPDGVEVQSKCLLDDGGNINFETLTAPWRGRGVLAREGPAIVPDR